MHAGLAERLDDEDLGAERDRLVGSGVELHRLAAERDPDLAVAGGR